MRAHITCHLTGDPTLFHLGIGDLIGRSEHATLSLDDPRVSEAHSMVSMRGQSLVLLALRGRFKVDGTLCSEVILRAGLHIELYEGCWLHCIEVILPASLPGLIIPGLPRTLLTQTTSLFLSPTPTLHKGYQPAADAIFWPRGESWSYCIRQAAPQPLGVGTTLLIGQTAVEVVALPLQEAAITRTRKLARTPLRIELNPKGVKIRELNRTEESSVTGIPGKLLAAVAQQAHPCSWEEVCALVWPNDQSSTSSIRRRFDVGLLRLREKLQHLGLPADLVQMDGTGAIALATIAEDQVIKWSP